MSLFVCDNCGCVDETIIAKPDTTPGKPMLCSGCQPNSVWHGHFEQLKYDPEKDHVINRNTGIGLP